METSVFCKFLWNGWMTGNRFCFGAVPRRVNQQFPASQPSKKLLGSFWCIHSCELLCWLLSAETKIVCLFLKKYLNLRGIEKSKRQTELILRFPHQISSKLGCGRFSSFSLVQYYSPWQHVQVCPGAAWSSAWRGVGMELLMWTQGRIVPLGGWIGETNSRIRLWFLGFRNFPVCSVRNRWQWSVVTVLSTGYHRTLHRQSNS